MLQFSLTILNKIYIKDSWSFSVVDELEGNLNNISIVGNLAGIGTTAPKVEEIKNATYVGDYGDIVGIGTVSYTHLTLPTILLV